MTNREKFANEIMLRNHIRTAIQVISERRRLEETQLRAAIRTLLNEADPAVSTAAVHSNTGINALEDLFKNTNLLSVLRTGYKSLTSKKEQRESYKNHILNAAQSSLEVEESRYLSPSQETEPSDELAEAVDINVGGPEDNPAFIDVEKKEPTDEEEVESFSIQGQDKTGRNRAYTDYKNVEKNLITAFDNLDDPNDRDMFGDYLLTNLKLYFDRFEEELVTDLPAPEIDLPPEEAAPVDVGQEVELNPEEMLEWLVLNDMKT